MILTDTTKRREYIKKNYDFYKSIGICVRCHKTKAEPNKIMCLECAGYEADRYRNNGGRSKTSRTKDSQRKKTHYQKCKELGICPGCGRNVESNGTVYCKRCRAKMKQYRDSHKTGEISTSDRSELPDYGICYLCCKNPVIEGKKVCESCYETRMETMKICWGKQDNSHWKKQNDLIFKGRNRNYE